ncbi:MAG TPA: macrolide ABC transporter ATP-binding protein [Armatimonadetes bacterium]|nr:macrolide ABC transporter ATP-binding protein [Armatimonadota bacterium]
MGEVIVKALRGATFDVPEGSLVVLLGPSGSGKTTLLNIIGGLDTPTSGTVFVDGQEVSKLVEPELTQYRRGKVGFIFQFFNLVPTLTAEENVALVGELAGNADEAADLLERVGLGERLEYYPAELSGGEQQRVAIARALIKRPYLLLGDEPTGNLDYETGLMVLQLIRDVSDESDLTVLMVTHNAAIGQMADIVISLRSGHVEDIRQNESPLPPSELRW